MISYIGEIAKGIDNLLKNGKLKKTHKVVLYGLDRYSFAMRTVLSHRGIEVYAFLSEDKAEVISTRRMVKDFACRYFRSERDAIKIWSLDEVTAQWAADTVILVALSNYSDKKKILEECGFAESKDFFKVYDFYVPEIDDAVFGKQELSMEEVKCYGKKMLALLDEFCQNNGLRYWVCGGTMLGTVRHNGFIPWDDDVDVFMPLNDYFRFLSEFPISERYGLIGFGSESGSNFIYPYAKIVDKHTMVDEDMNIVRRLISVWVDIFPLIGLPENDMDRDLFFRNYKECEKSILQEFYAKDGALEVFCERFHELEKYIRRYDYDNASYVGVLGTRYGEKDSVSRQVYEKTLRMKFEDIEVNVPEGYKYYLSSLYGDSWMKIPPENERESLHKIRAYMR